MSNMTKPRYASSDARRVCGASFISRRDVESCDARSKPIAADPAAQECSEIKARDAMPLPIAVEAISFPLPDFREAPDTQADSRRHSNDRRS
jgi:hypothetical protein